MRRRIFAMTIAVILASAQGALASGVTVTGAFARASATPAAQAATVYMTIVNDSGEADRILSAATAAAAMAHFHQSAIQDGVATMESVAGIDLPPGAAVELKPGGLHIMLTGLKGPLKRGTTIALILNFEKAGAVAVEVPVAGVAALAPDQ